MTADRFKKLGYVEATSLLVLLFIAMPLKYQFGMPEVVSVVGMIHGVLFTLYLFVGLAIRDELGWSYLHLAFACFIASVPFGPFIFERRMFPKVGDV